MVSDIAHCTPSTEPAPAGVDTDQRLTLGQMLDKKDRKRIQMHHFE
jgi:hypothetical protein